MFIGKADTQFKKSQLTFQTWQLPLLQIWNIPILPSFLLLVSRLRRKTKNLNWVKEEKSTSPNFSQTETNFVWKFDPLSGCCRLKEISTKYSGNASTVQWLQFCWSWLRLKHFHHIRIPAVEEPLCSLPAQLPLAAQRLTEPSLHMCPTHTVTEENTTINKE